MIDTHLNHLPHQPAIPADADRAARALRDRYRESGLRPLKRLGQHFLADLNLARRIASEAGPPGGPVLEIGAGLGALTFPLAAAGHTGLVVEIDRRLAEWLADALAPWPSLRVIRADIRTLDFQALDFAGLGLALRGEPLRVIGNLPYVLTSEILLKLVREVTALASAVIMVQEDVAARLTAPPGSRTYGSLTVALALRFVVETVVRAPRQAFWPAPEVDSTVLRLTPRPAPDLGDPDWLECVVRAGFAQRRKTLASALASGLGLARPAVEAVLRRLGIDPTRRAETIAPADFVRLAAELAGAPAGERGA